jgi:hypothetical protein
MQKQERYFGMQGHTVLMMKTLGVHHANLQSSCRISVQAMCEANFLHGLAHHSCGIDETISLV